PAWPCRGTDPPLLPICVPAAQAAVRRSPPVAAVSATNISNFCFGLIIGKRGGSSLISSSRRLLRRLTWRLSRQPPSRTANDLLGFLFESFQRHKSSCASELKKVTRGRVLCHSILTAAEAYVPKRRGVNESVFTILKQRRRLSHRLLVALKTSRRQSQLQRFDPNGLVRLAKQSVDLDERRRHRLVLHLVTEIEEAMGLHEARQNWQNKSKAAKNLLECLYGMLPCFWYGRKSGFALFFLYLINKLVHLCAALGHLFMMRSFLSALKDLHFGWTCAVDLVARREWRQTRVFPRVTFCDIPIKHLGQWNTRSIQCVLPLNILNEKLYIFLWFWTRVLHQPDSDINHCVAVRVFTPKISSSSNTCTKLALLVDKAKDEEEHQLRKDFVRVFLSLDGLFLLNLMEHNAGNMCVTGDHLQSVQSLQKEQRREDRRGERHDLKRRGSDRSVGQLIGMTA
uniref:Innexin n=1 Tax=Macrostomum lignano TaxID=282301 RepID=A0A1I8JN32_9PLAT